MLFTEIRWNVFVASLIIVYSVAFLGSVFTSNSVNSQWYELVKPDFTPPNFIFPIVWNILFFLIALSLYFSWISARDISVKKTLVIVFGVNLFLNVLWSFVFFEMQNPKWALFELFALWISIIVMIYATYRINKISSCILVPYFLWVSFAGFLNYTISFG
ncbi:MAG TPA: TspO/MBR family protein [Candidatus Nanoarchaeia archaeon]|nr:TspO/MBR family protein [Candidatus Nanoarchaeia archaeon]